MATGNHTADPLRPTDNFTKILKRASERYLEVTRKPLEDHPLARAGIPRMF